MISKIQIGETTIQIRNGPESHPDVKKVEIAYDEDGIPFFIQITKEDGSMWRYQDNTYTVPIESGLIPRGVTKED